MQVKSKRVAWPPPRRPAEAALSDPPLPPSAGASTPRASRMDYSEYFFIFLGGPMLWACKASQYFRPVEDDDEEIVPDRVRPAGHDER